MTIYKPKGPKDFLKRAACAVLGHSLIQTTWFGYFNCGRCGAQMGDTLAGNYQTGDVVVVGHKGGKCRDCLRNYKALSWRDKLLTPDPFKEEKDA